MAIGSVRHLLGTAKYRAVQRIRSFHYQRRVQHAFDRGEGLQGRAHGLGGSLTVSLTSFPARYETLHLTLWCLLNQSVRADRIVLWIAHEDIEQLPGRVRSLEPMGLEILPCEDFGSYKKIVFALRQFPDDFIVTADDDLYYPPDWLAELSASTDRDGIVAHRTHRVRTDEAGLALPYEIWPKNVGDPAARQPSADLLATTGAGALFPPQCLSPSVTDADLFTRLAPSGDDLWIHAMAKLHGTSVRKVGSTQDLVAWSNSQTVQLWSENRDGRNDAMIRAIENQFGRVFDPRWQKTSREVD